jgi:hypothetical protein
MVAESTKVLVVDAISMKKVFGYEYWSLKRILFNVSDFLAHAKTAGYQVIAVLDGHKTGHGDNAISPTHVQISTDIIYNDCIHYFSAFLGLAY